MRGRETPGHPGETPRDPGDPARAGRYRRRVTLPTPAGPPPAEPASAGSARAGTPGRELLPGLALLAQVLEDAPTLSALLAGRELRLVLQNRLSRELLGARRLGAPLAEVFPETAPSAPQMRRVLLTGETWQDERRVDVRDVDGQELVMRFVVSPVGQGPPY